MDGKTDLQYCFCIITFQVLKKNIKWLNLQFGDFQSKSPIFCGITD